MSAETRNEQVDSQARHWVVRLGSGDVSRADREAFETWRSEQPAHAEAFAYLSAIDAIAEERVQSIRGQGARAVFIGGYRKSVGAIAATLVLLVVAGLTLPTWRVGGAGSPLRGRRATGAPADGVLPQRRVAASVRRSPGSERGC